MFALHDAYQKLLDNARLQPDVAQAQAVDGLARLAEGWKEPTGKKGFLRRKTPENSPQQGAYVYGEVGRGKSMLMDLFFAQSEIHPKRRVHYHAFMMDVHARIHRWREENRHDLKSKDPLPPLADGLAKEARLLCLDEMQVTDVADAMILSRLFTLLFERGVKVLFTSNRKPQDLYLHGLQRDRFLPFIALIQQRLEVMELASAEDYRLKQLKSIREMYITAPMAREARARMDAAFALLTHGEQPHREDLDVQGHILHIPVCCGEVARVSFAALCATALGAADYARLAQAFTTILLDDIPPLSPEKRNEAKRFVTLVDILYEHKVKLICSSSVPPEKLYPTGDGSFEFTRTVSRLVEMQSESYSCGVKVKDINCFL